MRRRFRRKTGMLLQGSTDASVRCPGLLGKEFTLSMPRKYTSVQKLGQTQLLYLAIA